MKRRILSIILAVSLIFSFATVTSVSASAQEYGDFEYTVLDNGTVEITRYRGVDDVLEIPSKIDGKSVTSIGDYAFEGCNSLTSVTIPDSVTTIENGAFYSCDSLTSIVIPDSVTTLGDDVFARCKSLTSITIGNSVTTIGDFAFY